MEAGQIRAALHCDSKSVLGRSGRGAAGEGGGAGADGDSEEQFRAGIPISAAVRSNPVGFGVVAAAVGSAAEGEFEGIRLAIVVRISSGSDDGGVGFARIEASNPTAVGGGGGSCLDFARAGDGSAAVGGVVETSGLRDAITGGR